MKKIKILTLSDNPLAPSGVATQTKYMIEGLLKTGRYQFISLGGAIKHQDYRPIKFDSWGDDWTIYPVDDYGDPSAIRSFIRTEKPDILWFMTDPRFWVWLWEMENEIRPIIPMVYYHVWDNYPYPTFNKKFYDSTDVIATISKVTDDIVRTLSPEVEVRRVPHTVNTEIFKKLSSDETSSIWPAHMKDQHDDKFNVFWNNRNARRKQSGTLMFWFKEFLDIVGHDKARLIMHTEPKDPNGQDLEAILGELQLTNGEILLSTVKLQPEELAKLYNIADCTVNISDAEGFGLATLESLSCETPIIVTMTGGLQEQVTDGESWFGVGIEPVSKSIIGSQNVPFIYEDRINKQDFIDALIQIYEMSKEDRLALGQSGRSHVMENYSMENYVELWDNIMTSTYNDRGSWSTRNHKSWNLMEI